MSNEKRNHTAIKRSKIGKLTESFETISSFRWISSLRLLKYALLTLILTPMQILALILLPSLAHILPLFHHKLGANILGLKIKSIGRPITSGRIFFVVNHISYFDIIALGSILPARFIAKSEVATWPILGLLSKITRTIFIQRQPAHAPEQILLLQKCLEKSGQLILFPEGTSSDGSRVLPFKTSLFAAVNRTNATVQPITINYTALNGMPIERSKKPFLAWYGDMDLFPHLWKALSLGMLTVEIRFHNAVSADSFKNRKLLAKYCYQKVSLGLCVKTIKGAA